MSLLFALGASHRRKGHNALIFARVLRIETLDVEKAREKYPFAAEQSDLTGLAAKWGETAVRCIVLDKHSIRLAREIVNLSKGCLGMVRQFALKTGVPHFCHKEDLGKIVGVALPGGKKVYYQLSVPISLNCASRDSRDGEAPVRAPIGETRSAEEQGMYPRLHYAPS